MRYGYKEYKDLDLCGYYHKIKIIKEDLDLSIRIHKLRKECKELIENENKKKDTNKDKKAKRKRVNKKKDTDTLKIQDENLKIASINARGFASKRKSIEEILKNENVDIAIVSELSGKIFLLFQVINRL